MFGRRKNEVVKYHIVDNKNIVNNKKLDQIACAIESLGLSSNPYIMNLSDDLTAITGKYKINKLERYFPIHAQIVDIEALELHKLKTMIELNDGIAVCLKTDCVAYLSRKEIKNDDYYWDDGYDN